MSRHNEAALNAPGSAADRVNGQLMAKSLSELLNRVRNARDVLPHLAALERSLLKTGASVIETVPKHHLEKICTQLAGLHPETGDAPLNDLMQRLLDALEAHQPPQYRSTFHSDSNLLVEEISHTDFEAAAAEHAISAARRR